MFQQFSNSLHNAYLLQLMLTDPHAAGNMDVDNMTSEKAAEEAMERYREFQKKEADTNMVLRQRMRILAEEAKSMGVF